MYSPNTIGQTLETLKELIYNGSTIMEAFVLAGKSRLISPKTVEGWYYKYTDIEQRKRIRPINYHTNFNINDFNRKAAYWYNVQLNPDPEMRIKTPFNFEIIDYGID